VRDGLASGPVPETEAPSSLRDILDDDDPPAAADPHAEVRGASVAREPAAPPPSVPAARAVEPPPPSGAVTAPPSPPPSRAPDPAPAPRAAPPSASVPVEHPGSPDGPAPESPKDFSFAVPRERAIANHAAALRRAPDDASRPCWPADLVRSSPASAALGSGARPAIVVFFDDTARASRLAAADLLPVVGELEGRVDLVLVDLTPGRTLGDDERKLVRRYYLGYVPTTVVLSAGRARDLAGPPAPGAGAGRSIRLLKSERVDPALVRAAATGG
jgi:hypothetical protein